MARWVTWTGINSGIMPITFTRNPSVWRLNYDRDSYGIAARSDLAAASASFTFNNEYNSGSVTNRTQVFFLFRIRFRKLPVTESKIIQLSKSGGTGIGLTLGINTAGSLRLYNAGTAVELLGSATVPIGTDSASWTTVYGEFDTNAGVNNLGAVKVNVNGVDIFNNLALPGTGIAAATGMNIAGSMQRFSFFNETYAGANPGMEYDIDQLILGDTAITAPSRFTILPITGNGNYQTWLNNFPGFRHRMSQWATSANTLMETSLTSSRQSYTVATPRSVGITGNILSATIFGQAGNILSGLSNFFVRRNGVDTDFDTWLSTRANAQSQSLLTASGWTPDDTIEVGIRTGTGAGQYRWNSLFIYLEHDTPYVTPPIEDVVIQRINYTGTGAIQTVALPFVPTQLFIVRRDGADSGVMWWQGFRGPRSNQDIDADINVVGTNLYIIGNNVRFNQNTIIYDILCIKDTHARYVSTGGGYQIDQTVPYDTTGYNLETFLANPVAAWVMKQGYSGGSGQLSYWMGPGQAANATIEVTNALALQANYLNQMNATGVTCMRSGIWPANGPSAVVLGLKPDQFESVKLYDIVTYTGDGTGARAIPVDLNGGTPFWAFVLPHNNGNRVQRNNQMTAAGAITAAGAAVPNSIVSFAADIVNVGIASNANGVLYTLMAFMEGTDAGAANQYSGIYFIDPTARHDTLWDRSSGITTVNVKIPRPIYRTHFVGDE